MNDLLKSRLKVAIRDCVGLGERLAEFARDVDPDVEEEIPKTSLAFKFILQGLIMLLNADDLDIPALLRDEEVN